LKLFYKLSLLALLCPFLSNAQTKTDTLQKVSKPVFFVGLGINNSNFDYKGDGQLNNAKPSNNVAPQINAGADIFFDTSQQFVFRLQLEVSPSNKANLTANYENGNGLGTNTSVLKYTLTTAAIVPQVIFNVYNGNQLKVFIDAGLTIMHPVYSNKVSTLTVSGPASGTQSTMDEAFPPLDNLLVDIPLKAGISVKHMFDIYVGYLPKKPLNDATAYTISLTQYQFGIDYFFGHK
jgi:hypothetical protein